MGPIATELTKIALNKLAGLTASDVAAAARVARNVGGVAAGAVGVSLAPTVAAFVAGAAVGASVALLVAPETGRATRQRLARGFRKLVGRREAVTVQVVETRGEPVAAN